jgi:GNAT superfamily N-acetyltransferase
MRKTLDCAPLKIRPPEPGDAGPLAVLAGELGYPTSAAEMRARLRAIKPSADNAIFVAQAPTGEVIGWIHVSVTRLLEVPLRAEVNGLVVGEAYRSSGAGARLLGEAEAWAHKKKCVNMSVRSNVIRDRAHKFYERQGYEHCKTQKAFRKRL